MSKKPYDFLVSEKEPFIYIEKSIIKMKDGFLCACQGKDGIKVISPSGVLILLLGPGTSITQEASIFAAYNDMQIAFVRGGCNVHSFFMAGRYQDPIALRNQIKITNDQKINLSKNLLKYRFKLINKLNQDTRFEIDNLESENDLLLYEARWAKHIYKEYAILKNISFKRDFNGNDSVNERLNILNNALYSIITAIILSCNLSPSIAIMHGATRRGGLAFDLADLFKTKIIFDIAFSNDNLNTKQIMYLLSNRLKEDNFFVIKKIIDICLYLSGDSTKTLEEIL